MTQLAVVLDVVVVLFVVHSVVNAVLLPRPTRGGAVEEAVSVLLPARNEAHRVGPTLQSLLRQRGVRNLEILVYDDGSTDATADVVRRTGGGRVRLLTGGPLPPGWLGKPHACAQLAAAACGTVLLFVDADVVLTDDAVAATVRLMRDRALQFVSPYPQEVAGSWLERLVQPLLWWSWLALLPARAAHRSRRPSLAAANGQLIAVDTEAYRDAGGHGAVRGEVVEDVALARTLVRSGAHGGLVDGSAIARCRMYAGPRDLVDGYAKSAWCAFGSPLGAVMVTIAGVALSVLPWALVGFTAWAWPAAVGGPVSRVIAALRSGARPIVDAVAHPMSILAFAVVVVISLRRHRAGRLEWKARVLP